MTYTQHNEPPCHICNAKCCRYFALEIDKPTTIHEFENLKWYLLHKNTFIFVEENSWFLQVNNACKYLGVDNKCMMYDERPVICKEYGIDEDGDISCDKLCEEKKHDKEFYCAEDIEKYIVKRFPKAKRNIK